MNFDFDKTLEILEQTPRTLKSMIGGLSPEWTSNNEGGETWTVFDVIGHLVHGETTDWLRRAEIILSDGGDKKFAQFDRFAQFDARVGKTLAQLLDEFTELRAKNLAALRARNIGEADLKKTGIHPAFGEVNLAQLLSTWAVHDLDHVVQISRVMAYQYRDDVGPWIEYLRVLKKV